VIGQFIAPDLLLMAAILRGTLFLGSTAALTGSIFELAELHGRPRTSR